MGKKRKASSQAYNDDRPEKPRSSKLRIDTYQDVADSEDEFLDNRDRILLDEGPEIKRRRKIQEEDALLEASDEEVLVVGYSDDEDELDDEEDEDMQDEDEAEASEDDMEEITGLKKRNKKSLEDEEDEARWGESKQDYYGADAIDTEQAARDEEAEAKRLQIKQLEAMSASYGLVEEEGEDEGEDEDDDNVVTERLPDLEIPENLSPHERLKLLQNRYPELEAISRDWLALHELRSQIEEDASHVPQILHLRKTLSQTDEARAHVATLRHTALSAYLGACAMYFAVLTSTANGQASVLALPPRKLREHPVIQNMLEARQMWEDVKQYPRIDTVAELAELQTALRKAEKKAARSAPVPANELPEAAPKLKKLKKSKVDRQAEQAAALSEARRAERARAIEADLADLDALAMKPAKKPSKRKIEKLIINEDDSDLGDEGVLTAKELEAKAARKKSLKFYTSQIAQRSNKTSARGRDYGGDIDVPHRERLRDREARLNAAAEKRGRQPLQAGEELGSSDDEAPTNGSKRKQDGSDDEDYYDMVAAKSKQKKADRKEAAEAYAQAARENAQVFEVEEVGPDGKRKISYQIAKNKGLTPHRKKAVRNPRVKKKLKYQDKLKKLKSTKQVYKGGEQRGGYGGELSGIKTGLVKSVKL